MTTQFIFNVTISVDRDAVPGFGHTPESWLNMIFRNLLQNEHYHPTVMVTSSLLQEGPQESQMLCPIIMRDLIRGIDVESNFSTLPTIQIEE